MGGANTLVTRVERLTLERSPAGNLAITALGAVQGLPLTFDWRAGPLDDAAATDELRWPVATTIALGDTTLALTGRLRGPAAFTRSEFDFRITGENAGQLQELFNLPPSDGLHYDLRGTAHVDPDSVLVTGLNGSFIGGRLFSDTRLSDGSLTLRRGDRIAATLTGTTTDQPFAMTAQFGELDAMLATAAARWPLNFGVTLGTAALTASGEIARDTAGPSARIDLAISGDVVATANRLRPFEIPDPGPMTLTTTLLADAARVQLADTHLEIADGVIAGQLEVTDFATTPRVTAALTATGIDITAFATTAAPAPATAPLDRPFPLDWLDSITGSIALAIAAPRGLPVALDEAAIDARLADGDLELAGISAHVAGIELNGRGSLRNSTGTPEIALDVSTTGGDLTSLLVALGREPVAGLNATSGPIVLSVGTRGTTPRTAIDSARIELTLQDARIALSHDDSDASYATPAIALAAAPGIPLQIETVGRLVAHGGSATVDETLELSLTGGSLVELVESGALWPRIALGATSSYRGQPITLAAQLSDTAALLRREAMPVDVAAQWGPLHTQLDGMLVPTGDLAGSVVQIALEADDVGAAGRLLEVDGLPAERGSVSAELSVTDRAFVLRTTTLVTPSIEGNGEVTVLRQARPALTADWRFRRLDATPYVTQRDESENTDESRLAFHHLYSEEPLPLEGLRRLDLEVRVAMETFRFGEFVSNDVMLQVQLDDGRLDANASLDAGRLSVGGSIDAHDDLLVVDVSASGDSVPLAADMTAPSAVGLPAVSFAAAIGGRGATSLAIAESLSGTIELYLRGGRMPDSGLRFLFGSVLYQLLDTVNPFTQRQSYIDIDCAGAYFDVENGVLTTRNGILMQTPGLQVVGVGQTNLASGDLRMTFRTKRRQGIVPSIGSVVNEFVELSGTLDAPRVRISAQQSARRGLLAIATAGLSVLAVDVFGRLTSGNICEDLSARVRAPAPEGN